VPDLHLKGWGVLPAGTYVFKIADSQIDRHIVQIFNSDETQLYATVLAIPNYRLKPTDKTTVTFRERPSGAPPALWAWFYPGRNYGEEFVYSRTQAMELAKATNTTVLSTKSELPDDVAKETLAVSEPEIAQLKEAPVEATQPTGEEAELATAVTPPPATEIEVDTAPPQTAPTQVAQVTLPKTASPLPLIGLLGLLALGAALGLGLVQKRTL
jgi:hypothetical protein